MELTHSNLIACVQGYDEVIAFPSDGRVVSWLPMAHIAERACSHYMPMLLGFTTTCCPDPRQVAAYLPAVKPSWFFAVPRIWEKLKAAIEAGVAAEPDGAKRKATEWALAVGLRKVRLEQAGEPVPGELVQEHAKADELVLSKLRARLGLDEVESVNVGAAPTPPEVIEFFHAIGVPLAELLGMSETAGYGACNPRERIKIGTVGPPGPGIELKLADDGELLIRGPVIGQAIAIGDMRAYNVALITLDPDVAPTFARQHGEDAVLAEVERGVSAANEQLAGVEQIKRFKVLFDEWQPGGDELTPTMKLKRRPIHEKYAEEIEALYAG